MGPQRNHVAGRVLALVVLALVFVSLLMGCTGTGRGSGTSTSGSSSSLFASTTVSFDTTRPGASPSASSGTTFEDRIGSEVPGTIGFGGRTYNATGRLVAKVAVIPDDLRFLGTFDGAPSTLVLPNGRVYAMQGVDMAQAVAVCFVSAGSKYFYYYEYRARE